MAVSRAKTLKEGVFASQVVSTLRLPGSIDTVAVRIFLEDLLARSGSPDDPVEVMLLKQIALANFRLGDLHALAADAKGEAAKLLNGATARLLGEFRRMILSLATYRTKSTKGNRKAKAGTRKKRS